MRRSLEIRLSAVFFIILMGSFGLIRAEVLGAAVEQASSDTPCSYCGSSDLEALDVTILEGEEEKKAVATALSSQDYKNLKKVLLAMGYTPSIDEATAQVITMDVSDTEYEVLTVGVPFKGETELSADIVFVFLEDYELAVATIIDPNEYTLSFVAISYDGEVTEVEGSPAKGDGGVQPLNGECEFDDDCVRIYGDGWCCKGLWCEACEPPPPEPYGCKVMDDECLYDEVEECVIEYAICLGICFITGNPLCPVGCYIKYLWCLYEAYEDCCLEWW